MQASRPPVPTVAVARGPVWPGRTMCRGGSLGRPWLVYRPCACAYLDSPASMGQGEVIHRSSGGKMCLRFVVAAWVGGGGRWSWRLGLVVSPSTFGWGYWGLHRPGAALGTCRGLLESSPWLLCLPFNRVAVVWFAVSCAALCARPARMPRSLLWLGSGVCVCCCPAHVRCLNLCFPCLLPTRWEPCPPLGVGVLGSGDGGSPSGSFPRWQLGRVAR